MPKRVVNFVKEKVQSAVDAANQMTQDFIKSHQIVPNSPKTLAEVRKEQGEGWYQADIGESDAR
jgi:hypothetical protein